MLIFAAITAWKVARRTLRNRFKYRGVINVFNPISPFFDEKYMERVPVSVKNGT